MATKPLNELIGRELIWRRVRLFSSSYELVLGEDVLVRMEMHGLLGRRGTIRTADGELWFRRSSLFGRNMLVEDGTGAVVAEFDGRLLGGRIRLASGESYDVKTSVFPARVSIHNGMGSAIVTERWTWPPIRRLARVDIEPAGSAERQLGLITAIAFAYLVYRRRAAARSGG
jgi:hypothetical protein